MRRLVLLIALVPLMIAGTIPIQAADTATNCTTRTSPNGDKKLKICTSVGWTANQWWAHTELKKVTGFGMPYASISSGAQHGSVLWSQRRSGGAWCEGRYPACSSGGSGDWIFTAMGSQNSWNDSSEHYANNEHLCVVHSQTAGFIWWTQNQWENDPPPDGWGPFNSANNVDAGDDCVNI